MKFTWALVEKDGTRKGFSEDTTQPFYLNGCYLPPLEQPSEPIKQEIISSSQWDAVNQLRAEVRGWRQKHAEAMVAVDKLNERLSKKEENLYE